MLVTSISPVPKMSSALSKMEINISAALICHLQMLLIWMSQKMFSFCKGAKYLGLFKFTLYPRQQFRFKAFQNHKLISSHDFVYLLKNIVGKTENIGPQHSSFPHNAIQRILPGGS